MNGATPVEVNNFLLGSEVPSDICFILFLVFCCPFEAFFCWIVRWCLCYYFKRC